MSERCERTSERRSEWPSTLRVDFMVNVPTVHCSETNSSFSFLSSLARFARKGGRRLTALQAPETKRLVRFGSDCLLVHHRGSQNASRTGFLKRKRKPLAVTAAYK